MQSEGQPANRPGSRTNNNLALTRFVSTVVFIVFFISLLNEKRNQLTDLTVRTKEVQQQEWTGFNQIIKVKSWMVKAFVTGVLHLYYS